MNNKVTLEILLNHLENGELIHKNFDIADFNFDNEEEEQQYKTIQGVHNCGSTGCAIGEMPRLDSDWYFNYFDGCLIYQNTDTKTNIKMIIAEYFGIEKSAASHLFFSASQDVVKYGGMKLSYNASLKNVIFNMKEFLKLKKE
jgi:hypothetical protein